MASTAFPHARCAFLRLGWREKPSEKLRGVRRASICSSRATLSVIASVSPSKTMGGMRRRDDGTWDGAIPPRCRVSFTLPTPDTKRGQSTVTEASRKESSVSSKGIEQTTADSTTETPTYEPTDFSWTPEDGFIPAHENNIIAHLWGMKEAKDKAEDESAAKKEDVVSGIPPVEKFQSDDSADAYEATALIAAAEKDPKVFIPLESVTTEVTRCEETEETTKEKEPHVIELAPESQTESALVENNIVTEQKMSTMRSPTPTPTPTPSPPPPTIKINTMKGAAIIFVTSEVAPWSKTGGLGDVCGALPKALAVKGNAVVVVSPYYENFEGVFETEFSCQVTLGDASHHVKYFRSHRDGVTYLFAQHPSLQRGGGNLIYGASPGNPYHDNAFRFGLLSLAAIEAPLVIPWSELFFGGGEQGVEQKKQYTFTRAPVFVANDWHAALTPVFLTARYQSVASHALANRTGWAPEGSCEAVARSTCVTIVHNLFHLGIFNSNEYTSLHLPENDGKEWFPSLRWRWSDGGECMNFLKAGLALSSAAALVSPTYAKETQTKQLGCGMDQVLRSVGNFGSDADWGPMNGVLSGNLVGIVNGVDVEEWNPATDTHIESNYDVKLGIGETYDNASGRTVLDAKTGKARNKAALQRELGLREDPNVPLIGFIGRLDGQKGVDVLLESVPRLVELGAQVVLLGSGDPHLEDGLRSMEHRFRGFAVGWVGFSVPVSHRITAAVDILAMPSRFEPCGLNQLYALRYGSLPVAHKTGGLRDTVRRDVGWPFTPCDSGALSGAMEKAIGAYRKGVESGNNGNSKWDRMRTVAMEKDLGWDVAAEKYQTLFKKVAMPAPHGINADSLRESNPGLAEVRAGEDTSSEWREAERRAEKLRVKASKAPNRDTREGDHSDDSSLLWRVTEKLKGLMRGR